MHQGGPPRKVFRGYSGPRTNAPGSYQDFTVDHDTPPGAFQQSYPSGQPYLPPPPVDGPPHVFTHGHSSVRPPFYPPPPPHYGPYMGPPRHYPPPQWGQGYGHQWRGGWRGRGRGRHRGAGKYPQSRWRNQGMDTQSSSGVDAYYSATMFEDPWKDLLPKTVNEGEAMTHSTTTTPTSTDATKNDNVKILSTLEDTTSVIGLYGQSDVAPDVNSNMNGSNSSSEDIPSSDITTEKVSSSSTGEEAPVETTSSADSSCCKETGDVSTVDCAGD